MIGDDYFTLRAQLGTALFALQTLASDLDAPSETINTLHQLQQSLREPFLFVVVGEVKAGKSSLLNAILGEKLSIVSPVAQTTRNAIRGIHTTERGQIVFVDTPGIHRSKSSLGQVMNKMARVERPNSSCRAPVSTLWRQGPALVAIPW